MLREMPVNSQSVPNASVKPFLLPLTLGPPVGQNDPFLNPLTAALEEPLYASLRNERINSVILFSIN